MSEIRTLNVVDTYIYPAATINAALRGMVEELQDQIGAELFDAGTSGEGIFGGFDVTEGAARRSDIKAGVGIRYDAGAAGSKWTWIYSGATIQKTHDAHEGSIRYDLLTITAALDTDTEETLGRTGGTPAAVDTQRGSVATITITKGTAGAGVPSTPAGHILLYVVKVPATSGALEYWDNRPYLPGPRNRNDRPLTYRVKGNDSVFTLAEIATRKEASTDSAWTSYAYRWNREIDRPFCTAQKSGSKNLYFMLAEDRKWWESTPIIDGPLYRASGDDGDLSAAFDFATTSFKIGSASADAAQVEIFVPIRVQARALKIVGAKLDYHYGSAFDGSSLNITATVFRDGASTSTIASLDIDAAGTGARANVAMTVTDTVIAAGDRVLLGVLVQRTGTGISNVGDLKLYAVALQFEEMN